MTDPGEFISPVNEFAKLELELGKLLAAAVAARRRLRLPRGYWHERFLDCQT